ncbi:hypothetical protein E8E14_000974 [Neopestalotiopsis sp. 37M]|nr:hypothetical protein E8E14_000974 [Neopestalotiopsis sp. 37M]
MTVIHLLDINPQWIEGVTPHTPVLRLYSVPSSQPDTYVYTTLSEGHVTTNKFLISDPEWVADLPTYYNLMVPIWPIQPYGSNHQWTDQFELYTHRNPSTPIPRVIQDSDGERDHSSPTPPIDLDDTDEVESLTEDGFTDDDGDDDDDDDDYDDGDDGDDDDDDGDDDYDDGDIEDNPGRNTRSTRKRRARTNLARDTQPRKKRLRSYRPNWSAQQILHDIGSRNQDDDEHNHAEQIGRFETSFHSMVTELLNYANGRTPAQLEQYKTAYSPENPDIAMSRRILEYLRRQSPEPFLHQLLAGVPQSVQSILRRPDLSPVDLLDLPSFQRQYNTPFIYVNVLTRLPPIHIKNGPHFLLDNSTKWHNSIKIMEPNKKSEITDTKVYIGSSTAQNDSLLVRIRNHLYGGNPQSRITYNSAVTEKKDAAWPHWRFAADKYTAMNFREMR